MWNKQQGNDMKLQWNENSTNCNDYFFSPSRSLSLAISSFEWNFVAAASSIRFGKRQFVGRLQTKSSNLFEFVK